MSRQLRDSPGRAVGQAGLILLLLTVGCAAGSQAQSRTPTLDPAMHEPAYFDSPQTAVATITKLLRDSDWLTLSRYYDVTGTDLDRADLESGAFFVRTERPEVAHPGGFWRFKQPFAPGFEYSGHAQRADGTVRVNLSIRIDQGGGTVQQGYDSFTMRKTAAGYQILPPSAETAEADPTTSPTTAPRQPQPTHR